MTIRPSFSSVSRRMLNIPSEEETPDIAKILAEGDGSRIGKNVIEICKSADISFLALHGEDGENGKVQATFDMHGIKYTGSGYLGSAIAMNKEITKIMLRNSGIPVPEGIVLEKGGELKNVGFPCVVKPCSGGSSVGTSMVANEEEYAAALELAFKYEDHVLVERFIKGRELTVGVMGGKAMPVIEIIPKTGWYDYKNKYQAGRYRGDMPCAYKRKGYRQSPAPCRTRERRAYGRCILPRGLPYG